MRKVSIISVMLMLAGAGCAGSQGEQVRDARMEQANANADEQAKAVDAQETAREQAIEDQHDVAHAQIAAANPPAEGASQQLVKVSEERAAYQSQAKARLEKVGIRLDAAKQKLSVLGSRAPTQLRDELTTTSRQYNSLQQEVMSLNQTPASNWEAATDQIDQRLESLDTRVTNLSDSIESV